MFDYTIFRIKRAFLQFFCNFIPFKHLRIKARNAVYAKFNPENTIIFINQVDTYLPKKVLAKVNSCDNEYFIEQNKTLTTRQGGGIHRGYFEFDQNSKQTNSPLNPWAFIRVCNEAITLKACLESILPAIQRGVIAYNDCTDGSEEIILEFCQKYPSFIPAKYPHQVQIHNPQSKENKLYTYYNFALTQIPKNEWLINIDCDHIYDAKKLYKSFYLPKHTYEMLAIARINVLVKENKVFILINQEFEENFFVSGIDHRLIYNKDLKFKEWFPYKDQNFSYEVMRPKHRRKIIHTELNNYHFPQIKQSRASANNELIKTAFTLDEIKQSYLVGTRIDPALLDEDKILQIYDHFAWDKANYPKP